jgi:hypothetical protein
MTLHVPMRVGIRFIVLLVARHFDLLEPPLGQHRVGRSQITSQCLVPKPQSSRQRMDPIDFLPPSPVQVIHDLNDPVVVIVPNCPVPVAAHFVVALCHWRNDGVRVQVPACRTV